MVSICEVATAVVVDGRVRNHTPIPAPTTTMTAAAMITRHFVTRRLRPTGCSLSSCPSCPSGAGSPVRHPVRPTGWLPVRRPRVDRRGHCSAPTLERSWIFLGRSLERDGTPGRPGTSGQSGRGGTGKVRTGRWGRGSSVGPFLGPPLVHRGRCRAAKYHDPRGGGVPTGDRPSRCTEVADAVGWAAVRRTAGGSGRDLPDGGLGDLARPDARRADVESPRRTVDQCPDPLDVGIPPPLGPSVGVADVHAEPWLLTAYLTHRCHDASTSSRTPG